MPDHGPATRVCFVSPLLIVGSFFRSAKKARGCDERLLFRGFLIIKFRGDQALLQPGVETTEHRL